MLLHLHPDFLHLGGRSHDGDDGHHRHLGHGTLATAVVAAAITAAVAGARVLDDAGSDSVARTSAATEQVVEQDAPTAVTALVPAEMARIAVRTDVSVPAASTGEAGEAPATAATPVSVAAVESVAVAAAPATAAEAVTTEGAVAVPSVEHTIAVPTGTTVTLVVLLDPNGLPVARAVPTDGVVRFENLPAGSYRLYGQAETGVTQVGDGAVSAAHTTPLEPVEVGADGTLVVRLT